MVVCCLQYPNNAGSALSINPVEEKEDVAAILGAPFYNSFHLASPDHLAICSTTNTENQCMSNHYKQSSSKMKNKMVSWIV